jgi:hypothetical protein
VEGLLHALSPDGVFPYALWEKAYAAYWKSPAAECSRLYKFDNSPFPEAGQLQEKYFPIDVFAQWMIDFFYELARRISVMDLENGFDYIVESTYDDKLAVNETDRDFIFYHIKKAGSNIANAARTKGLREINVNLSAPHILLRIFPDTIAVDKIAAIHYLSVVQKYPFVQEVKGITRSLVEAVIKAAAQGTPVPPEIAAPPAESAAEVPSQEMQNATSVSRSLWQGKTQEAIFTALREKGLSNEEIAHILFYKRGFKEKRAIGKLLHDNQNLTDGAYDKHGDKLFRESKNVKIIDEE